MCLEAMISADPEQNPMKANLAASSRDLAATRQLSKFATAGPEQRLMESAGYLWRSVCTLSTRDSQMVFKIEKVSDEPNTVLRLSGRIESEDVQELKAQIDGGTHGIVLDLEQVRLVNLDVVHFLMVCENQGIELRHCPPYVLEWILSEKVRMIRDLQ